MTATYNLLSSSTTVANRSKVRLYARDTNTERYGLADTEWDVIIAVVPSGNLKLAAAWGLRSIAVDNARLGRWKDAGISVDVAVEEARKLAEWLEGQALSVDGVGGHSPGYAAFAGGISISDKLAREQDTDRVIPAVKRRLHEHPSIKQIEDYGYRGE